uniref:Uncharacterized protein LOC108950552 n=1 Tax=Phallusia mammillata TaxID=59560 RepID=A0A6F9DJD0_9ASCI|nr:uncharacterized protein LOC108950552 [Phallusia mammillata]
MERKLLTFRGSFYQQVQGTAMGSPVSVVVANMTMEALEEKALSTFANPPRFWRRYVDDIFCVIAKNKVEAFLRHLNEAQPGIQFTMELQSVNCLPFLDVQVTRTDDGVLYSRVYHKPTSTGRYLNFRSHHPTYQKRGVVRSLKDQARRLCTHSDDCEAELAKVRKALKYNGYPNWILRDGRATCPKQVTHPKTEGFCDTSVHTEIDGYSTAYVA